MIFASVGTQEPFDRLVDALDRWARRNDTIEVLAQIGPGRPPRHVSWVAHLAPHEFRSALERAQLVVTHAGMGTLLNSLQLGKPLVVMPRRAALGEHRNDHQLATAERFCRQRGIRVVHEAEELERLLDELHDVIPAPRIRDEASPQLLESVRAFIESTPPRPR